MVSEPLNLEEWEDLISKLINDALHDELDEKFRPNLRDIEEYIDAADFSGWLASIIIKRLKTRLKSACEFYLEWRNDPKLFINWYEDKKKVDELLKFLEHHFGDEWYDNYDNEPCVKEKIVSKYNEWLFKLAFKDVLGDKE